MNKKQLVEKYLRLSLWYLLNTGDKDISVKVIEKVADEIGKTEDTLRELGTTEKGIQILLDHLYRIKNSKIKDLKPSEQPFICKVTFGEKCKENGYKN